MSKLLNRKVLKIASATLVCVFSLFVTFASTFAWFASVRSNNNNNVAIEVTNENRIFKSFSLYEMIPNTDTEGNIIPITSTTNEYHFSKTPLGTITYDYDNDECITTGDLGINIGTYSLLDQFHPVLGIFEFYPEASNPTEVNPVAVYAHTDMGFVGETVVDETTGEISYPNELQDEGNPLSSIIQFTTFGINDLTEISTRDDFEIRKNTDLANATVSSFVEFNDTYTEATMNNNPVLFKQTSGSVRYAVCLFNFNATALEYIYATYLGNDVVEGGEDNIVGYTCDFTFRV